MKRRNHIEVVPVWRERVDHRLYVLALLAFVEQLAGEAKGAEPSRTSGEGAGSDGKEVPSE